MSENSHGDSAEIFDPSKKLSFVHYVQLFSSISINYLRQTADKLVVLAAIYSVFSLLAYFLYLLIKTYVKDDQNESMKRVLIVTAHPDDECMFFGPTIVNLRARNIPVHLLCLSPGDSVPNKRQVRKAELWQSCIALGIDQCLIELKKHTLLMDGHKNEWSHKLIAKMVLYNIEMLNIDTVITFDEMGVSEHPNHIALFNAMAYLTLNHLLPADVCFYSLDSVNRLRKYSFMLDFLTSFFLSKLCLISNLKQQYKVVKAMSCHKSQFVWYRKLYIIMSRYVTINTLRTWTWEELKECVKYQEMVDGMKYKNKWYESLDDSLKKINSEKTISTLTKTDDFEYQENAEDDGDVSFVAKTPEPSPSTPETRTRDSHTPSPQRDSHSPSPDPSKLGANESIHNGEVYVRKSRFLIPKTYGSFYNSSSSETSDDKDDGEPSSSCYASLDKVDTSLHKVNASLGKVDASLGKFDNRLSKNDTGDRVKDENGEETSISDKADNGNLTSKEFAKSEHIQDLNSVDAENTILCTDTDVDNFDDEDENNLSYEIEDIESVLNEFENESLDIEQNSHVVKKYGNIRGNGLTNVAEDDVLYNNDMVKAKEQILEIDSKGDFDFQYDKEQANNRSNYERTADIREGRELSHQKYEMCNSSQKLKEKVEQLISLNDENVVIDHHFNNSESNEKSNGNKDQKTLTELDSSVDTIEQTEVQSMESLEEVKNTQEFKAIQEVILVSNIESSNSSEQESAVDDARTDNNLNKRNRKRRKNKKKQKRNQKSDDPTPNNHVDDNRDNNEAITPKEEQSETNNTLKDKQLHEHSNSSGKEVKDDSASKIYCTSIMEENDQNIFNVDRVCNEVENVIGEDDTNAILQPVSTN